MRKPLVIIIGLIAIGLVAVGWTWRQRSARPSIVAPIEAQFDALFGGDSGRLLDASHEFEREALELDQGKLRRLVQEVIVPNMAGLHAVGEPDFQYLPSGGQCMGRLQVGGLAFPYYVQAEAAKTDEGPRSLVMTVLLQSWVLEAERGRKERRPQTAEARAEAYLAGLRRDRKRLDAIGIKGLVRYKPDSPLIPWNELERVWAERAAPSPENVTPRP